MMNGSSERVITIRHVKGDKLREVPIRRELVQLLRLHIGGRRAGRLFVSRQQGSGPTSYMLTRQRARQLVGGRPDWPALATAFRTVRLPANRPGRASVATGRSSRFERPVVLFQIFSALLQFRSIPL